MLTARYVRFHELRESGLVNNRPTLNNWIAKFGFPPGQKVGGSRMWTVTEVNAWLMSRPVFNELPLKRASDKIHAERVRRRNATKSKDLAPTGNRRKTA
jgi:hypothetical protein